MRMTPLSRLAGGLLIAAGLACSAHAAEGAATQWIAAWGAAPAGPPLPAKTDTYDNQTLRLIVHTTAGGRQVRIRLSNEMGSTPLRIGAAHVALRAAGEDGGAIQAGTDRALAFGGKAGITIPPGAAVLSDPVALDTPALADLAVSLYLPGKTGATSLHGGANQVGYVSKPGDFSGADLLPTQRNIGSWPFLTEVDVDGDGATIVTLGDSITDGANSTRNRNERWPDRLAQRLQAAHMPLGVVNRGISGNRLLVNPDEGSLSGRSILERFDRDVLAAPGVRYMTLMIGINDIGHSSPTEPLSADDLIAGYRQVIARAHAHGIQVFGATLTPFEGAKYYSPEKEALRQAVNTFVRSSREFDGVIDFDRVTRDPANPGRFLPAYDSGDHLHPGDKGYEAMGDAVPLEWFKK